VRALSTGCWQHDAHGGSLIHGWFHPNPSAMMLDDAPTDCPSDASAGKVTVAFHALKDLDEPGAFACKLHRLDPVAPALSLEHAAAVDSATIHLSTFQTE
jgi:hypothetical protein